MAWFPRSRVDSSVSKKKRETSGKFDLSDPETHFSTILLKGFDNFRAEQKTNVETSKFHEMEWSLCGLLYF